MILPLSTAGDLSWLGRYMVRAIDMHQLLEGQKQTLASHYLNAIGCELPPPFTNAATYINDELLPTMLERINDNVQTVRGVIDRDAYQLFNDVKSLRYDDSLRAACFQLHACSEAMRAQEPIVTTFWSLGYAIEQLDSHIRHGFVPAELFRQFAIATTSLPSHPAWDRLKQPAQALVFTNSHESFADWQRQYYQIFDLGLS